MDFDGFWKDLIARFWRELLKSVIPDLYDAADLEQEPEFLDKELRDVTQDFNAEEHNPPRFVDTLMKIVLKDGGDEWVLLHIEIQGSGGENLSARMYRYYCLLFAHHGRHPAALAILTEPRPKETTGFYEYSRFGTSISYCYNCLDIDTLDDEKLKSSDNPFDLAIYAARKAKLSRKDEMQKFHYLREVRKLLNDKGWNIKDRRDLLLFLERIINLKDNDLKLQYFDYSEELEGKKVPYESWIEKHFHEEGLTEGIGIGRTEGIGIGRREAIFETARRMLASGLSYEDIMKFTDLSGSDIQALKSGN